MGQRCNGGSGRNGAGGGRWIRGLSYRRVWDTTRGKRAQSQRQLCGVNSVGGEGDKGETNGEGETTRGRGERSRRDKESGGRGGRRKHVAESNSSIGSHLALASPPRATAAPLPVHLITPALMYSPFFLTKPLTPLPLTFIHPFSILSPPCSHLALPSSP